MPTTSQTEGLTAAEALIVALYGEATLSKRNAAAALTDQAIDVWTIRRTGPRPTREEFLLKALEAVLAATQSTAGRFSPQRQLKPPSRRWTRG